MDYDDDDDLMVRYLNVEHKYVCRYSCVCACLTVGLSVYLSAYLSVCMFTYLSACIPVHCYLLSAYWNLSNVLITEVCWSTYMSFVCMTLLRGSVRRLIYLRGKQFCLAIFRACNGLHIRDSTLVNFGSSLLFTDRISRTKTTSGE